MGLEEGRKGGEGAQGDADVRVTLGAWAAVDPPAPAPKKSPPTSPEIQLHIDIFIRLSRGWEGRRVLVHPAHGYPNYT